jgi:hypothetical protein
MGLSFRTHTWPFVGCCRTGSARLLLLCTYAMIRARGELVDRASCRIGKTVSLP